MPDKRLLVADDSLTIQKVIRLALSNEGYEIEAVSDGNDASQQIPLFRPDIILVDVSLPGRDAFDLKKEFNEDPDRGSAKFVLMSSAFEELDEGKASSLGFNGRLVKPFDPAHLRKVLAEVSGIKSEALTPVPEKSERKPEKSDDLWSDADNENPIVPPAAPDEDIRQLTEATVKMSGLDNLDWDLQEPAKKESAPQSGQDMQGVKEVSTETWNDLQSPDPVAPPKKNMMDTEAVSFELGGTEASSAYHNAPENVYSEPPSAPPTRTVELEEPTSPSIPSFTPVNQKEIQVETESKISLSRDPSPAPEVPDTEVSATPITEDQIEKLVAKEIRETLEKQIQSQLPGIAEKVIREELDRILSNPPSGTSNS